MLADSRGLVGKVADALGIERPPPAHATGLLERFSAAQHLREEATAIFRVLDEPMAMLTAACCEAGVIRTGPQRLVARYDLHRRGLVALLRGDTQAAMLASSLVQQYSEAQHEFVVLEMALQTGNRERLQVERAKGKFFYLTRMRIAVADYPPLVQLFGGGAAAAPPRAAAPARGDRPVTATAFRKPGASQEPEAGKSGKQQPESGKGGKHLLEALQDKMLGLGEQVAEKLIGPPASSRIDPAHYRRLQADGNQLAQHFQVKMLILQAALQHSLGRPSQTESLLPLPAMRTAETIGAALAGDREAQQLAQTALESYRDACFFLRRGKPEEHEKLKAALTNLAKVPAKLGDHAVLTRLFSAA